ncbi:MAG: TenA family transcriptional regulator [Nitrososphaerota archaeon]
MRGRNLIEGLRRELETLNRRIEHHPFLNEAEKGLLSREKLKLFIENQYYIVYHDLRSLAVMVSRATHPDEADYLSRLQLGDLTAFQALLRLGEELEVPFREFSELRVMPGAVAYTHYLAWLALYGVVGEQVAALVVNLPVWGRACERLSSSLRKNYGIRSTEFLDAFANPPGWIEEEGGRILERYMPGIEARARLVSRMIQSYELGFWDSIYGG